MDRESQKTTGHAASLIRAAILGACALTSAATPTGLSAMGAIGSAQASTRTLHTDAREQRLISALMGLREDKLDVALREVEKLVEEQPDFKLAQIVYADLLLAMAKPLAGFGSVSDGRNDELKDLLAEARVRWRHHKTHPPLQRLPEYLVQLEAHQRNAVVVDLKESRLFVYENRDGRPVLVDDYYVSMGKNGPIKQVEGDKRTPVGVYFVTDFLPPEKLPDYYGAGAFPIDYPNAWDRRQRKTGYGIWLHGNPLDTYSRPPLASDGCVTMSNSDFTALMSKIDVGETPVIIANGVDWAEPDAIEKTREEFLATLQQWKQDWESLDTERYLSHYSSDFATGNYTRSKWTAHKRAVNSQKAFIDVDISNLSVFRYPHEAMMVVTYQQNYNSSNYSSTGEKRQYWRREDDGRWRIVYEGPA